MAKVRPDKNSTTALIGGFKGVVGKVPLPQGCKLRSPEELVMWEQYTRPRAPEDWRDIDLRSLVKIVKREADILKHQETLDRSGILIKNQRGTLVVNPLMSVIDMLIRSQGFLIRSMSLMQLHSDPRTVNGAGKANQLISNNINLIDDDNLIAQPKENN